LKFKKFFADLSKEGYLLLLLSARVKLFEGRSEPDFLNKGDEVFLNPTE
jgi:hypothetical protein